MKMKKFLLRRLIGCGIVSLIVTLILYIAVIIVLNDMGQFVDYDDYGTVDEFRRNSWDITTKVRPVVSVQSEDEDQIPEEEVKRLLREAEYENSLRLQTIQTTCEKHNLGLYRHSIDKPQVKHPPVPQYSVFYFDTVNKWSLCPIYKAGSSTWLYNLCLLGGMTSEQIDTSNTQLSTLARYLYPEFDAALAEQTLQTTIKVITVRHPFERLLSAYRDKLENTNYGQEHGTVHFYRKFGSKIVKKYREGGNKTKTWDLLKPSQYSWNPKHPKPAGVEPTFREFVKYLIDLDIINYSDDHWIPYYLYCTPCLLKYDIVAKIETFYRDQLYLIRVAGLQDKIKPRWRHKTQFQTDDTMRVRKGNETEEHTTVVSKMAQVYFSQLTTSEVEQLHQKYYVDFELFGYSHKQYLSYAADS